MNQATTAGRQSPAFVQCVLSDQEQTLVRLVSQGLPDWAIAAEAGLSRAELSDCLLAIFRKLATAGLLELLLYSGDEKNSPAVLAN